MTRMFLASVAIIAASCVGGTQPAPGESAPVALTRTLSLTSTAAHACDLTLKVPEGTRFTQVLFSAAVKGQSDVRKAGTARVSFVRRQPASPVDAVLTLELLSEEPDGNVEITVATSICYDVDGGPLPSTASAVTAG